MFGSSKDEKKIIKTEPATDWPSIYTAGICSFIQAAQFSLYLSSMWPFLRTLDPTVSEAVFGLVLATYSIGQCIFSPSFGYWSNHIKQVRIPLFAGFFLMVFGNLLYLCLPFFNTGHVLLMGLARFITGSGTGNLALLRTYASTASTLKDRSRAIACVSGGFAVGLMFGPAFQLVFTPLGSKGISLLYIQLNIYTGPAILALLMNMIGIIILKVAFSEKNDLLEEAEAKAQESQIMVKPDSTALTLCYLTRFTQVFLSTAIESIASPFSMMMFGFTKEEAVRYGAMNHAVTGSVGALIFFSFLVFKFTKSLKLRSTSVMTVVMYLVWLLLTYAWPVGDKFVSIQVNGSDSGCQVEDFDWCNGLTTVSPILFYSTYALLFGIAVSLNNIVLPTLFSKIIGPRRQGTQQGIYHMSGSVGRLIAPVIASAAYTLSGPRLVWKIEIIVTCGTIVAWMIMYRRMISIEKRKKTIQPSTSEPFHVCV